MADARPTGEGGGGGGGGPGAGGGGGGDKLPPATGGSSAPQVELFKDKTLLMVVGILLLLQALMQAFRPPSSCTC
ncbi:hypothetical protein FNF27_06074 [Cafeteria roenbergensis]|uniref:Uncharacterized protein n=1 Tax=Cafeteria roenbergensis TaxID=33653 RepID=A0A5A8D2A7_CAFRO|nr:hypothetical protein FNF29_07007 [Cafeteria roenbergensis]KAA0158767.1 hypothetical protein FNF28_06100 [Cafeteria roenbergensis]KAA0172275.1 hypothetical protein FNF27_06074 [Cafeteria roenbergensis]|eukprot:KAA0147918.1 hypothetical protein FNF29_07007 [Cafeteria roenbergensis]